MDRRALGPRLSTRGATITVLLGVWLVAAPGSAQPLNSSFPAKSDLPALRNQLRALIPAPGTAADTVLAGSPLLRAGDRLPVTVRCSDTSAVLAALGSLSRTASNVLGEVIEVYLNRAEIVALASNPYVLSIEMIESPRRLVLSQGRPAHNASGWIAGGYTGSGVKVGIIDSFVGLQALMGTELPATIVGRCYYAVGLHTSNVSDCERDSEHGTAVAESLVDIAPGAALYIANPDSKVDFNNTVNWMVSQGVKAINFSASYLWDGPGDGSSPYSDSPLKAVDSAVAGGAVFVAAAGNEGTGTWFGTWNDSDADGWHQFSTTAEVNRVSLVAGGALDIQLRWQDTWSAASKDLDLGLYDSALNLVASSSNSQSGATGQTPFEFLSYVAPMTGDYYFAVRKYAGADPSWLQVQTFTSEDLQFFAGGSIGNPAETANSGALAVGAAAWSTPSTIETYSSRGPTPDGRTKPDLVGADKADTVTYGAGAFSGTSQASPHVAGLAALVAGAFPSYTPQQIAGYLKSFALPRGTVPNNTWGAGFAWLPDLCTYSITPTSTTVESSGGASSVSVQAAAGCTWTATSNASFITIAAGASGTGDGTVSYSVSATSGGARTGTLTIAGLTFTVTQAGSTCSYSVSPTTASFGLNGGTGSVSVTGGSGCSWTAQSNASFLSITGGSPGTGNGTVFYQVAANGTSAPRTGTLMIAGQTFTLTQGAGAFSWSSSSAMTTQRAWHGSAVSGAHIYALGGFYRPAGAGSDVRLRTVEAAAINGDGTLGSWQATTSMSKIRIAAAAVAGENSIYVLGGEIGDMGQACNGPETCYTATVDRSAVNGDGTLGSWQPVSSMTGERWGLSVVRAGSYLYALGGIGTIFASGGQISSQPYLNTVEHALVNSDGTLGPWQAVSSMTTPRWALAAVYVNGFVYALGGKDGLGDLATVEKAAVNGDGSLGSWQLDSSLPTARQGLRAVAYNGYIYVTGGYSAASGYVSGVVRSFVRPDGSLVGWEAVAPMTTPRGYHQAVAANGYMYAFGGSNGNGFVASAERAVIDPPDTSAPAGSVSINGAASFTNSQGVMLDLAASDDSCGVSSMAFSDDGVTFSAAEPYGTSKAWMLTNGDGPKTVYARFGDCAGRVSSNVSASIHVDTIAPLGSLAILGAPAYSSSSTVTLQPSATDGGSGVVLMGFSNDGTTWSTYETNAASKSWTLIAGDGSKTVYVRFKDGAGNVSAAAMVSIGLDTTAPVSAVTSLAAYQTTTSFSVKWTGADATSGVAQYDVQTRDGSSGAWTDWITTTTTTTGSFSGQDGHIYSFRARSRDAAGNQSAFGSGDTTTTVDTVAPMGGTLIINGGARTTTSIVVTASLSASDGTSGVKSLSFSNDGSTWDAWLAYAPSTAVTLSSGSGQKTLFVRFQDAAGNVSTTTSAAITLDTAVPTEPTISINDGALYTNATAVVLTLGARAGTAEMQISNDGAFAASIWEPYASHKKWTITQYGTYVLARSVYARFRDVPGTITGSVQDDIMLDVTPPEGSVTIGSLLGQNDALSSQTPTVSLHIAATDDISGVAGMSISSHAFFPYADWETYATTRAWTLAEGGTVYVKFRDRAGNISEAVTVGGSAATPPFGAFDTPSTADDALSGSFPVTGWALDDGGVVRVEIWRDPVPSETTIVYRGAGPGDGRIFVANPPFVGGARPDIETIYRTYPGADRAGWGYLLLSQGLWNQGNGSYTLYAFAFDKDGRSTTLGVKTIEVRNSAAIRPFGALDVPDHGETRSGQFFNFGWALTPQANSADPRTCMITDGSVFVGIDSGPLAAVDYGDNRTDIATYFPGFSNSNNGGGHYLIDTTTLTDGTHQIGWYVVDNCGRADGIGSRFFRVLNGSSLTMIDAGSTGHEGQVGDRGRGLSDPTVQTHAVGEIGLQPDVSALAPATTVTARITGGEWRPVPPSVAGAHVVAIGQRDRVEVRLARMDGTTYTGAQQVNGELRALPLGSSLDAANGIFYWQPAAGFLGAFNLVFTSGGAETKVRLVVGPSTRMAIDMPSSGAVGRQPFTVAGWALDLAATEGAGIDSVHVWAHPAAAGRDPIFLGVADSGDSRPDLAATYGEQFERSAFSLTAPGLSPGTYDVVGHAHRASTGTFEGAQRIRVIVP